MLSLWSKQKKLRGSNVVVAMVNRGGLRQGNFQILLNPNSPHSITGFDGPIHRPGPV